MIDWGKLREAHELCERTDSYVFDATFGMEDLWFSLRDVESEYTACNFENIDKLIAHLKTLIVDANKNELQSKFKSGDKVWYLNDKKSPAFSIIIEPIPDSSPLAYTDINGNSLEEGALYSSLPELIDAQIEHWVSFKGNLFKGWVDCDHLFKALPDGLLSECKKCGAASGKISGLL